MKELFLFLLMGIYHSSAIQQASRDQDHSNSLDACVKKKTPASWKLVSWRASIKCLVEAHDGWLYALFHSTSYGIIQGGWAIFEEGQGT